MDTLTEKLGIKLQEWQPDVAVRLRAGGNRVRQYIMEIIDLAVRVRAGGNRDVLDLLPSRAVEQDVLDLIDEP